MKAIKESKVLVTCVPITCTKRNWESYITKFSNILDSDFHKNAELNDNQKHAAEKLIAELKDFFFSRTKEGCRKNKIHMGNHAPIKQHPEDYLASWGGQCSEWNAGKRQRWTVVKRLDFTYCSGSKGRCLYDILDGLSSIEWRREEK